MRSMNEVVMLSLKCVQYFYIWLIVQIQ